MCVCVCVRVCVCVCGGRERCQQAPHQLTGQGWRRCSHQKGCLCLETQNQKATWSWTSMWHIPICWQNSRKQLCVKFCQCNWFVFSRKTRRTCKFKQNFISKTLHWRRTAWHCAQQTKFEWLCRQYCYTICMVRKTKRCFLLANYTTGEVPVHRIQKLISPTKFTAKLRLFCAIQLFPRTAHSQA